MDPATLRARLQKQTEAGSSEKPKVDYKTMNLLSLGEVTLQPCKHGGKTLKEVYETDQKWILWLLDHHPKNPKFEALLTYVSRVEEAKMNDPKAILDKPPAGYQTSPGETSTTTSLDNGHTGENSSSPKPAQEPQPAWKEVEHESIQKSQQVIYEADFLKVQLANNAEHCQQIQEALTVQQAFIHRQQEEIANLHQRLSTLENLAAPQVMEGARNQPQQG